MQTLEQITPKQTKQPKKTIKKTWANISPDEAARLRAALDKRFPPLIHIDILDWRAAMK